MSEPSYPMTSRRRRLPGEGTLEVLVADEQSDHPVDAGRWVRLAEDVLLAEGIRGEALLDVLFVDEQAMADLNVRFMEEEGPTDVLAFPLEDDPVQSGRWPDGGSPGPDRVGGAAEPPLFLGDVVICPAVAAKNAPLHGGSYDDELALLLVHGILHVLGHDHAEADDEMAMQARQRELLDRFYRKP